MCVAQDGIETRKRCVPAPQLKSDTPPFIESDIYIHHSIQNHHLIMTIVPHILQPAMSTLQHQQQQQEEEEEDEEEEEEEEEEVLVLVLGEFERNTGERKKQK
ncbi:hypothetical protein M433DRAFT_138785 [Acidomyces richmondensis BFW]|nr:MAG: hypothetical protein FE78DRAFT_32810 [Acidomyces sp. 'richmondensis']KYG40273.1 hypothetical protein M433DRAFT_138785 [Acidomyces richmondensis BFW]